MRVENKCNKNSIDDDRSSPLFPYPFVFRSRDELSEHIRNDLTSNRVVYYTKLILGMLTLILPLFNMFTVYRSMIYQKDDFSDIYSIFHGIIFYGEFALVHLLLIGTLIIFVIGNLKNKCEFCSRKGRWINLLDLEFTLMAFNLIKLIPILSVNGFNFLFAQISICGPIFLRYSRSSQIISFTFLFVIISIEVVILIGLLILINLVKVYQVSFVGEIRNPFEWTINQWLLFIGFAANIINITDIPTVSPLAFMWSLTTQTWSQQSNLWLHDQLEGKRKVYLSDQIYQTIGFFKGFLWIRTMSAIDLHSLIRLPPSDQQSTEQI